MKNLKRLSLIVLVLSLLLSACAPSGESASTAEPSNATQEFTKDELAAYNGENGAKAYIAVDGVVYDVSAVTWWKGGKHNGFEAGRDLSQEIKTLSPHGTSKLEGLPVVDTLK